MFKVLAPMLVLVALSDPCRADSLALRAPGWPRGEQEQKMQARWDAVLLKYDGLAASQVGDTAGKLASYRALGRLCLAALIAANESWQGMNHSEPRKSALEICLNESEKASAEGKVEEKRREYLKQLDDVHAWERKEFSESLKQVEQQNKFTEERARLLSSPFAQQFTPACKSGPLANSFRADVLTPREQGLIEKRLDTFCSCLVEKTAASQLLEDVRLGLKNNLASNAQMRVLADEWQRVAREGIRPVFTDRTATVFFDMIGNCRIHADIP